MTDKSVSAMKGAAQPFPVCRAVREGPLHAEGGRASFGVRSIRRPAMLINRRRLVGALDQYFSSRSGGSQIYAISEQEKWWCSAGREWEILLSTICDDGCMSTPANRRRTALNMSHAERSLYCFVQLT